MLIRYAMHDFHFPHLNLLTLSSIQRQAYILDVHVRCTTSETFYSVKISVARATQLRRLIVGIAGLMQCAPSCFRANSLTVSILNTTVVFSSKSRSGYVHDMIILVKCLSAFGHKITEHPWIKARSTVKYNEGPVEGISIPLKLFNPQFPFFTFFFHSQW